MTKKQLAKQKRNREIKALYSKIPIEDIAQTFNISVAQIYQIMEDFRKHE